MLLSLLLLPLFLVREVVCVSTCDNAHHAHVGKLSSTVASTRKVRGPRRKIRTPTVSLTRNSSSRSRRSSIVIDAFRPTPSRTHMLAVKMLPLLLPLLLLLLWHLLVIVRV